MTTSAPIRRRALALLAATTVAATALLGAPATTEAKGKKKGEAKRLQRAVKVEGILEHLRAFQDIALDNDGNRAAGFPGYDASSAYVQQRLEAAGYEVTTQEFDFEAYTEDAPPVFEQTAPGAETYTEGEDFLTMEYSGSGDVTAGVTPVDLVLPPSPEANGSTSGCEDEDFAGFPAGDIALMQRGTCPFADKAQNALEAGAAGALIFNEGQEGRTDVLAGTLGGSIDEAFPVLGLSFELGETLAGIDGLEVHVVTATTVTPVTSHNVFADTAQGDASKMVIAGGHLDSVGEGPGINDNGSGTASLLEVAEEMAELKIKPKNKVRFAFWGAEEAGLVGSNFYTGNLTDEEIANIAAYLNFDMVGSPNFVRFVYDGDGSAFGTEGPAGSDVIEGLFHDAFEGKGLESAETEFSGRSDYFGFIQVGIPSGGLFSGAEGVKTEAEEEIYGGVAGMAYDPCYHQECDNYFNPSTEALGQFSDAMAWVIAKVARNVDDIVNSQGPERVSGRSFTHRGGHAVK